MTARGIFSKPVIADPWNALAPMKLSECVRFSGLDSFKHDANAEEPIVLTADPNDKPVIPVPWNALDPMATTLLGITIRPVIAQFVNALFGICVVD